MRVVLLSRDLMFISRVKEVASARQGEALIIKSQAAFAEALRSSEGTSRGVVLIDLEKSPLPIEHLRDALTGVDQHLWRCIGFYSHVHVEAAQQAREAGLQEVIPRSKFVQMLPSLF